MSQLTLALLKPDLAASPIFVKGIVDHLKRKRLSILAKKVVFWSNADAEEFYKQHRGRFFYRRLVEYTSSGPMLALLLSGRNSIHDWRTLMGPTKTFKAIHSHPNSLRARFGLTDTRNSTHGSDSEESVLNECDIVFGRRFEIFRNNALGNFQFSFGDLAKSHYWDSFYDGSKTEEVCSEWFVKYESMEEYILPLIHKALQHPTTTSHHRIILDIGCGISAVGPRIAKKLNGLVDVYCIDFTMEALLKLRKEIDSNNDFHDLKNCFLIKSDITKGIPFDPASTSVIIDKGCLDSILKQNNGQKKAAQVLSNILQLLNHGGVFLQISDEPPDLRLDLLNHAVDTSMFDCDINCQQLLCNLETKNAFLYVIQKI